MKLIKVNCDGVDIEYRAIQVFDPNMILINNQKIDKGLSESIVVN